jgi:hypothetical protein
VAEISTGVTRLSSIAALAAGEAYSIFVTFFTHALKPPIVYAVDQYTHRRLSVGQIGYIEEAFYWSDLFRVLAVSLALFLLVWWGSYILIRLVYRHRMSSVSFHQDIATHYPLRTTSI